MRFFSTVLFLGLFIGLLSGQGRSGRYSLDGNSWLGNQSVGIGGGYFIKDRFLGGLAYSGNSQLLSPSVRYYFFGGEGWRPYLGLGASLFAGQPGDLLRSIELNAGVERQVVESVLLNVYTYGNRNLAFDDFSYGFQGALNALLGAPAGATVAERKFQPGALTFGNQLGGIERIDGETVDRLFFNVNPSIGLLLGRRDQLTIRPLLAYSAVEQNFTSPSPQGAATTRFITMRIDVGYRRYLFTDALFNPYAEGFVGYRASFGTITRNGDKTRSTSYRGDFGLKIGTTTFIAPAVSVDTDLEVNRWVIDDRNGVFVSLNGGLRFWLK